MIESTNNSHIKNIIKLKKNSRERKKQKLYMVEGPKMVLEALKLGLVKEIYISEDALAKLSSEAVTLLDEAGFETVSGRVFKEISDTVSPQGMIALADIKDTKVEDVIHSKYGIKHFCDEICCMPVTRILILEDVQDPGNLGTMLRTAEAAGFNGVIMNKGTADAYNPKTVRSSMGAALRLPFAYGEDICDIIDACKSCGITVYGTHLLGNDIRDVKYSPNSAFVIGNESKGMSERAKDACDENIRIPMNPASESLNAAVAAGITMYHSSLKFF